MAQEPRQRTGLPQTVRSERMNRRNYSRELDQLTEKLQQEGRVPSLLLHCCCAPCSSACLERLREDWAVTVFYYNPNISAAAEYQRRKEEELRLIGIYNEQVEKQVFDGMHSTARAHRIDILDCDYDTDRYYAAVRGLEDCPEGGERCTACFRLRLRETARAAAAHGFEYCSTTLTISPMKDVVRLNAIGEAAAAEFGVKWLPSEFRKKNGFKRSVELSHAFGLYRQDYCGCVFSRRERASS